MAYKVLLVEDEEQIRAGLKSLIEDVIGGFRVVAEARNGEEALAMLKREIPELIITDIRMGRMNGLDMIETIRNEFPEMYIIIISGYQDFVYAKKAILYNVQEYLLKPIDRAELAQSLTRFRRKREKPELPQSIVTTEGAQSESDANRKIQQIRQLVADNLDRNISLQFIADKLYMNRQYLSTFFKQHTGENFVEYVIQCRMNRAKELLRDTNLKVYEIAKLCGYENIKYFMTVFKQLAGTTPGDYRESNDQPPRL